MSSTFFKFCCYLAAIALRSMATLELPELDVEVPPDKGLIIVANHRSVIDILVGLAVFRRWRIIPRMLVKASFFTMPGVGWLLYALRAIPTSRERARTALEVALGTLRQGGIIALTAEGRVTPSAERKDGIGNLRSGAGRLAAEFGTTIVVAIITNTDHIWPLSQRLPRIRVKKAARPTIKVRIARLDVAQGASTEIVMAQLKTIFLEIIAQIEADH